MKIKAHLLIGIWIGVMLTACSEPRTYEPEYRAIREGRRFGYINRDGEVVIPATYAYAMPFNEGMGAVNVGGTVSEPGHLPLNGKWGFINQNGRFIINPKYYSPPEVGAPYDPQLLAQAQHEGYIFSEGLAAVRVEDQHWVYINQKDSVVIDRSDIQIPRMFREGLANVYDGRRWGYIDKTGKYVIPPRFLYPANFRNGRAFVVNGNGRRYLIDKVGNPILPYYRIESPYFNGVALARPGYQRQQHTVMQNRSFTLIDTAGRFLFTAEFDRIGRWGNGMAPVLVGSIAGDPVSHPAPVKPTENLGGKWGFINGKGQIVVNPVYQDVKGFSEGFAAVKSGGLWAYIDSNFDRITGYEFRWVDYFHNGIAEVRLGPVHGDYDGRYAFINNEGDVIWVEED